MRIVNIGFKIGTKRRSSMKNHRN